MRFRYLRLTALSPTASITKIRRAAPTSLMDVLDLPNV